MLRGFSEDLRMERTESEPTSKSETETEPESKTMIRFRDFKFGNTQPTFTCSKLTIEVLEQGKKYVQS